MKIQFSRVPTAWLLTVLALCSILTQAPAQTFTTNSPLLTARWSHTATLLTNGLVLIAGGTTANEFPGNPQRATNSCELYNPFFGVVTPTGSMPDAAAQHVAVLLTNGLVLEAGGRGDFGGVTARAALYYPASGSWTNTGFLNQSRTAFAAALLADGKVLAVGGFSDDNGEEASAEIYDPATGNWTTIAPLNYASDSLTATVLPDGRVLVAGGSDGSGGGLTNASIFNPTTQTWTPTSPLKRARVGHAAVLLPDGEVLVAGGTFDNSAELYDPGTGKWTLTSDMNENRLYPSLTLLPNGQVLAIGGAPDQMGTELYDPDADVWTSAATLNVGRVFHTATLLEHGQVLVTGGDSGIIGFYNGPALADVETYNQASPLLYALNQPNLDWTTGGATNWFLETTNTHDGIAAAESGQIGNNDETWIETTVTGPGTLVFWWQVFSDVNTDTLEFQVDDVGQEQIAGTQAWSQFTYMVPPGDHTLKWVYFKLANGSTGFNAGFVDEVSFVPTPSLAVSALPSRGIVPLTVQFVSSSVDANGNAVTNWNWNFDDGGNSTNQNPSHIYATAGVFNPTLVARGVGSTVPLAISGLGQIIVTNRPFGSSVLIEPQLKIEKIGDQTVLSVFNRFPGSLVESTTNLNAPAPWPQVIPFPDGLPSIILQPTNPATFFRLRGSTNFNINSVAPALDQTEFDDVTTAAEFIYNGTNGIQTGVPSGVIKPDRAAVLHGRVLQRDGSPLANTRVSVLDHTEFGQTFTRADGRFDLALNGGFEWRLNFEKFGYLPAQRSITPSVQDYQSLPDVVLIPVDPVVTVVTLGDASTGAVARASTQTDADGSRTATMIMPPGLHGSLVMPDGSAQAISTIHVRATEFTVGTNGPAAMPAALPPTSGYTYAVELSADEAFAVGANTVNFDQDIPFYVENFIGFPVGLPVPSAYYDRQKAAWVPIPNGRVIKITQVANNLVEVDTDGDGLSDADHGASIGITTVERGRLATLYAAGQTLWRVPVQHFTPYDHNHGVSPAPGALPPQQPDPKIANAKLEAPSKTKGYGTVEAENRVLSESIPIVGTPFSLNYSSDQAAGDAATYQILVYLSGTNVPAPLKGIRLTLEIAGRTFVQNFSAAPNQSYLFTWDGLDAYGRKVQGPRPLHGQIDYIYTAYYNYPPPNIVAGFALATGQQIGPPVAARDDVNLSQSFTATLGSFSRQGLGFGGWGLSAHHIYDPENHTLYLGTGEQRRGASVNEIVKRVAGSVQPFGPLGDGGPALNAKILYPYATAFGPDGSMYIATGGDYRIRRVTPDGTITTITGQGSDFSYGDGGLAVNASVAFVTDVAVGPDGGVYFSESGQQDRIRKIATDGIITTVAGGLPAPTDNGPNGDGGPATQARIAGGRIAIAPDGTLYIDGTANTTANKIRRVGPDGIITTFAGLGPRGFSGDGGPATAALLDVNRNIALGPDGSLYISDSFNHRVRRITPDGIINTVFGAGNLPPGSDGVRAVDLNPGFMDGFDVGPDGSIYFSCIAGNAFCYVYRVTPDGIAHVLAGVPHTYGSGDISVDNVPGRDAQFDARDVTLGPDGSVYICDNEGYPNHRVLRIAPPLPGFEGSEIPIPSTDASEVYVFDKNGRHLRTVNALTGAILLEFHYNAAGQLASIRDNNGLVTTIEHDLSGNLTGILAPFGQHTTLGINPGGFLASVTNPASETTQLGYLGIGLLSSVTGPKGDLYTFNYDGVGHLLSAGDSAGGSTTLTYNETTNSYEVQAASALGRVTHYFVETLTNGTLHRLVTYPDGTKTESLVGNNDGVRTTTLPDGTVITSLEGPDPRFGMQSPVVNQESVVTPGGLTNTTKMTRTVTLTNPDDIFSVSQLIETRVVNGRTNLLVYYGSNRTFVATSPEGRSSTNQTDAVGRTISAQTGDMNPVYIAYDVLGRLTNSVNGSGPDARPTSFNYDSAGRITNSIDATGRSFGFDYDAAGRVTQTHLPGGRVKAIGYDLNGRVTSITPPGQSAHQYGNNAVNQVASYTLPAADGITNRNIYRYNSDRDITNQLRADGQSLVFNYDTGGRLAVVNYPNSESLTSSYDPASGHLTNMTSSDGSAVAFGRDGTLLTNVVWTGTVTGRVSLSYDRNFRIASQQVNGANPISFLYDQDGLITNAGSLSPTYQPQKTVLSSTRLGAIADSRTYNAFGDLTNCTVTFSNAPFYSYALAYNLLGRITNKTETIGGQTVAYSYTYDTANRLSAVRSNGVLAASYAYDLNGNRLGKTNGLQVATYTYDARDRLRQRNDQAGVSDFAWTPDGELRTQKVASVTSTFTYDARGNLRTLTKDTINPLQVDYLVDGLNRRIGKKINSSLTRGFLYQDNLSPIAELDGNNAVVSRFIYGARLNVPEYMIRGGVTYRLLCDHLGSVRLVVNVADGTVAQRIDYDEFGVVLADSNPAFQPFGFAGGIYDSNTGLTRFGARDYDAATGRWTSRDPVGFRGGDTCLYNYLAGDPVNQIDPTGMGPFKGTFTLGVGGTASDSQGRYFSGSMAFGFDANADVYFFVTSGFGAGTPGVSATASVQEGAYVGANGSDLKGGSDQVSVSGGPLGKFGVDGVKGSGYVGGVANVGIGGSAPGKVVSTSLQHTYTDAYNITDAIAPRGVAEYTGVPFGLFYEARQSLGF